MGVDRTEKAAIIDAYIELLIKGDCDVSPKLPCIEKDLSEWFFIYVGDKAMWPIFRKLAMKKGCIRPW